MINIAGFRAYRFDWCNANPDLIRNGDVPKRGGGVIVYVKCALAKYIKVYDPGTIISKDYEVLSLLFDKPGMKHMLFSCIYRPPTGNIENLVTFLRTLVDQRIILPREKWIMGDFNIDFLKRNLSILNPIKKFLRESGLRQLG